MALTPVSQLRETSRTGPGAGRSRTASTFATRNRPKAEPEFSIGPRRGKGELSPGIKVMAWRIRAGLE